jgi:hypothetical protein
MCFGEAFKNGDVLRNGRVCVPAGAAGFKILFRPSRGAAVVSCRHLGGLQKFSHGQKVGHNPAPWLFWFALTLH